MAAWLLGGDGQGPFIIHRLRFFRIYVEIPNNINIDMSAFRDTLASELVSYLSIDSLS